MLDLAAVFAAGLLGSAHCVGMCGGLVAVLGRGAGPSTARQGAYFAGKTTTYATLGALAGLIGVSASEAASGVQLVATTGLGLVLVVVGLGLCGVLRIGREPGRDAVGRWIRPLLTRVLQSRSAGVPFGLGLLNGLLPCGLVYGMLAMAATTGTASGGALTMAAFGLSTLPALGLAGWLGSRLSPGRRVWMQRLGGVLIVALGVLTLSRAALAFDAASEVSPEARQEWICVPGSEGAE
ncbi:MAG: sulfite exporter TauE/SafE family protein [Bacteroidota bacterium]